MPLSGLCHCVSMAAETFPSVLQGPQTRASQHISKPMKQSILGKDQDVFLCTSITCGQRQVKQSGSRACSDELGALAGWCTLLQRRPQRRDLSLRLSLATISIPSEAASSSTGTVPREGALVKYSYIRRNYICKSGLRSDNWLEGRAGKNNRSEGERGEKAEPGKWKVSCDFPLPKRVLSFPMARSLLGSAGVCFWWLQRSSSALWGQKHGWL